MLLLTFGAMVVTGFEPMLRARFLDFGSQHKRIIQRPRVQRCASLLSLEKM